MGYQAKRELTFGEKAVGLTFNPSNNPRVQKFKKLFAKVIDELNSEPCPSDFGEDLTDTAIQQVILAQMSAVKAVTWDL